MIWQRYPLIRLVIPFTLGMVEANCFFMSPCSRTMLACCWAATLLLAGLTWRAHIRRSGGFGIMATALFFLLGMTWHTQRWLQVADRMPQDATFVRGVVTDLPQEKARTWALKVKDENEGQLLLYAGKADDEPAGGTDQASVPAQVGDTIVAHIKHLQATWSDANNERAAYYRHLFHHGISATAYVPKHQWNAIPNQKGGSYNQASFSVLRERLHAIYDEHGIGGETGSIVEAMTIGRKTDVSEQTRTAYAKAGASHVLALSGFHVGILMMMIQLLLLKNLLPLRWQRWSHLLVILTLWAYAAATGFSPSLVRASIMFTVLLVSQLAAREFFSLNSCVLAFFVMLCIDPFYLYDLGFQLSFVSVTAIGLCQKHLRPSWLRTLTPIVSITIQTMGIALICSLFTAPLVAYHFGSVPLLSLVSNVLLTPFVYLLMLCSILFWMLLWQETASHLLAEVLCWAANMMNQITAAISDLPFATIEWSPNIGTTLICYAVLLMLCRWAEKVNDRQQQRNLLFHNLIKKRKR